MELGEDPEGAQRAPIFSDKNKMPKTPDFSERMVSPKRANPFIFDDWGGSSAANTVKP